MGSSGGEYAGADFGADEGAAAAAGEPLKPLAAPFLAPCCGEAVLEDLAGDTPGFFFGGAAPAGAGASAPMVNRGTPAAAMAAARAAGLVVSLASVATPEVGEPWRCECVADAPVATAAARPAPAGNDDVDEPAVAKPLFGMALVVVVVLLLSTGVGGTGGGGGAGGDADILSPACGGNVLALPAGRRTCHRRLRRALRHRER